MFSSGSAQRVSECAHGLCSLICVLNNFESFDAACMPRRLFIPCAFSQSYMRVPRARGFFGECPRLKPRGLFVYCLCAYVLHNRSSLRVVKKAIKCYQPWCLREGGRGKKTAWQNYLYRILGQLYQLRAQGVGLTLERDFKTTGITCSNETNGR